MTYDYGSNTNNKIENEIDGIFFQILAGYWNYPVAILSVIALYYR